MITILWYLSFSRSILLPKPQPNALIIILISALSNILCSLAFSTFRIFPLNGSIAWNLESLPSFALPPAELPSTIYISQIDASLLEQSTSLVGRFNPSNPFLRLVFSLARCAARRASDAAIAFSIIIFATDGFSKKYLFKKSPNILLTAGLTSAFPIPCL